MNANIGKYFLIHAMDVKNYSFVLIEKDIMTVWWLMLDQREAEENQELLKD